MQIVNNVLIIGFKSKGDRIMKKNGVCWIFLQEATALLSLALFLALIMTWAADS